MNKFCLLCNPVPVYSSTRSSSDQDVPFMSLHPSKPYHKSFSNCTISAPQLEMCWKPPFSEHQPVSLIPQKSILRGLGTHNSSISSKSIADGHPHGIFTSSFFSSHFRKYVNGIEIKSHQVANV